MDERGSRSILIEDIEAEAENLLATASFRRAPVLARLLRYLVETTARGESVNSYAIAFSGLGKDDGDNADADIYARVTVARLRRVLAAHYAAQKGDRELQIDPGTYQVRLRPRQATEPLATVGSREARSWPWLGSMRLVWVGRGLLLLLLLAIIGGVIVGRRSSDSIWSQPNFPTLSVSTEADRSHDDLLRGRLATQRSEVLARLENYVGFRLMAADDGRTDFTLRLSLFEQGDQTFQSAMLVDNRTGGVAWAHNYEVRGEQALSEIAHEATAEVGPINGALNSYLRRQGYSVQNPSGCWLRFTEDIKFVSLGTDEGLGRCAQTWYEHANTPRLAAVVYGWTLFDRAASERNADQRDERFNEGFALLHKAIALDPDFGLLYLADMRGHALRHQRAETIRSARDAIRAGQHNRLIIGLAATMLACWNDPEGERLLLELQRSEGEAYPWEHIGLFAAAMMRDDTKAAHTQVVELEKFNNDQPYILVVQAAYASRTGQTREAEAALDKLRANPQIRRVGAEGLVSQLPIAPEVLQRLRDWLLTPA